MIQKSEYMAMMQGDDGTPGTEELIVTYEQGIADLRSAVAGLTAEQVRTRPIPGKWSTVECVGHLADTEIFFTDRIVRTIAMDRPLLMSADENLYIERLDYQSFDLDSWFWPGVTNTARMVPGLSQATMSGRGTDAKVDDLKFKDRELTFSVTRERNDMKFTVKYKAKIEGDTIKGKAETEFSGEKREFEFEGKREKKTDK